jgi:uncharacterized protein YrrD
VEIFIFRVNDIIDLPIIDRASGQRICTVKDVIIDARENKVYALVCKEHLIRRVTEIIPYDYVIAVTQNFIMITKKCNIIKHREIPSMNRRFFSIDNIIGKLILNAKGEIIGIIRDIMLNTSNGSINAYEISEGYFDDLVTGRRIIKLNKSFNIAEKNMVLKEYNQAYANTINKG